MKRKVLVVEDELDILEVIEFNLSREGFKVLTSSDGEEGLALVKSEAPDLVLLDLMLPGIDGIEICRRIREDPVTSQTVVVMLTAKSEESDVVLGLGIGADDYIAKPFSPREVIARVKANLRRAPDVQQGKTRKDSFRYGDLVVDYAKHEVTLAGTPQNFTATEFRLLRFLADHQGRVFTRDELLTRGIKGEVVVVDRNIDVHIRSIRKKLGPYRDLIETIRGVGYRFKEVS